MPPALAAEPELDGFQEEVARAFYTLTSSRRIGFSMGPIPMSEIRAYMDTFGVPGGDVEIFVHLVQAMDMEWLEVVSKRSK